MAGPVCKLYERYETMVWGQETITHIKVSVTKGTVVLLSKITLTWRN